MKLNPSTASRKWLRKLRGKREVKQDENQTLQMFPSVFDKWSHSVMGRQLGRAVVRSKVKTQAKIDAYMERITKKKIVPTLDGGTQEFVQLIDNVQNRNKYTNGSLAN